jgi:DNA-binding transcriptional regulator YbjK
MATTRTRALDAAIELVGTEGLRALTHARIDERAGLPRGSTSNYFRTRAALLSGVVDHLAAVELTGLGAPSSPDTVAELVDLLVGYLGFAAGPGRTLTQARLVLFLEAAHTPALREAVARGRLAMTAFLLPVLERLGSPDAATGANAIMAASEGLTLHRVARDDTTDVRPILDLVVRAAVRTGS